MSNDERQPDDRKKKASQKRQRQQGFMVRATAEEHAQIRARAEKAGLSASAFIRAAALGDPGPRAKRQPPVNRKLLAQAVAELNKIGSNINQIARALNSGHRVTLPSIEKAAEELSITLAAVVEATGKE